MSSVSWNLRPFMADLIFGVSQVIRSQIRGTGCVFHFSNWLFGRKLLVSWSIVTVENPIIRPKFRPFSLFLCLKFSSTAIALYLNVYLNAPNSALFQHFHRFCEIWTTTYLNIFHVLATLFEPLMPLKNIWLFL
jgi:hypothetical protein